MSWTLRYFRYGGGAEAIHSCTIYDIGRLILHLLSWWSKQMSTDELKQRMRLLDNEIRIMKSDIQSIDSESESQRKRIKENLDKIKLNKQLPFLVGNVVEVLDMEDDEEEEDGAAADIDSQRKVGARKWVIARADTQTTLTRTPVVAFLTMRVASPPDSD
jgi:26S proteasome regulatory subunit T5